MCGGGGGGGVRGSKQSIIGNNQSFNQLKTFSSSGFLAKSPYV